MEVVDIRQLQMGLQLLPTIAKITLMVIVLNLEQKCPEVIAMNTIYPVK